MRFACRPAALPAGPREPLCGTLSTDLNWPRMAGSGMNNGTAARARQLILVVVVALTATAAQPAAAGSLAGAHARAVRDLERQNVKLIADTVREARREYAAGVITATEVAQVEARLALARSSLAAAEAQYDAARANYLAAIGVETGEIAGASRHKPSRKKPEKYRILR
jgi:outer membrane protein